MRVLERSVEWLGENAALGQAGEAVDRAVRPLLDPAPVRSLLSGSWFGHRLHPAIMLAPVATLLSAALLDRRGDEVGQRSADRLARVGLAFVAPTALAGMSDWLHTTEKARRVGLAHAAVNVVATALAAGSVAARARGNAVAARAQIRAAAAALGVGGYLGGHLSYVYGTGVARTAFMDPPADWTRAATLDELPDRRPQRVDVDGFPVLLVARDGEVYAIADRCNHLGCSIADNAGELEGDAVTCGCHGSRYRVTDGTVLAGPAASSQPVLDTRVRDGVVEVRRTLRESAAGPDPAELLTDRFGGGNGR